MLRVVASILAVSTSFAIAAVPPTPEGTLITKLLSTIGSDSSQPLSNANIAALNLKENAIYSQIAYCINPNKPAWSGSLCNLIPNFALTAAGGDDNTNAPNWYVGYNSNAKSVVVAFEGTETPEEWIDDDARWPLVTLDPRLSAGNHFPSYATHGFQNVWAVFADPVLKAVAALVNNPNPNAPVHKIQVTGHSLGGAVASFSALQMSLNFPKTPIQLTTFATPRIGSPDLAAWMLKNLGNNTIFTVYQRDPFVHAPPLDWAFSKYSHVGYELWNSTNVPLAVLCSGLENPSCSDSLWYWYLSDHYGPFYGLVMGNDTGRCQWPQDVILPQVSSMALPTPTASTPGIPFDVVYQTSVPVTTKTLVITLITLVGFPIFLRGIQLLRKDIPVPVTSTK
ncbi:alpha/beta-hydrolase [Rickenella mellea]|uniref:Alpha/beta-hydrolase n=1 Tax=Rickenella mellea TaxID=50990 RepID=A0A4Y7PTQ8_9AGAM|nr:alpha/beta-hydrolase [Rickenella mellea]